MLRIPMKPILLSIAIALECLLSSPIALATVRCDGVFSESGVSPFRGYFTIEKNTKINLHKKHEELVSQKLMNPEDSISQSGLPKPFGTSYEVQFPQDKGKYTIITVHGQPYRENGQTFIDFKIWRRDWGGDHLINDRDSKFLRRMTLEAFLEVGSNNFISTLKYRRKMVLIKTSAGSFEMWFIQETNNKEAKMVAISPRGEEKSFSYFDIANWNLGFRIEDFDLFKEFFQLKGIGSIYVVPAQVHLTKIEPERTYLLIQKLPTEESKSFPLFSSGTLFELKKVLSNDLSLLLTGEGSGIHAAVGQKLPGLNLKGSFLIITPSLHKYIITHEGKHLSDKKNGLQKEMLNLFSSRFPNGEMAVTERTLGRFFTLISEQRAYQAQFEAMRADATQIDKITVATLLGTRELSFNEFIKNESKHQRFFKEVYLEPIREEFRKLKLQNPDEWQFFFNIAMRYSLPSKDFPIQSLFE